MVVRHSAWRCSVGSNIAKFAPAIVVDNKLKKRLHEPNYELSNLVGPLGNFDFDFLI